MSIQMYSKITYTARGLITTVDIWEQHHYPGKESGEQYNHEK